MGVAYTKMKEGYRCNRSIVFDPVEGLTKNYPALQISTKSSNTISVSNNSADEHRSAWHESNEFSTDFKQKHNVHDGWFEWLKKSKANLRVP